MGAIVVISIVFITIVGFLIVTSSSANNGMSDDEVNADRKDLLAVIMNGFDSVYINVMVDNWLCNDATLVPYDLSDNFECLNWKITLWDDCLIITISDGQEERRTNILDFHPASRETDDSLCSKIPYKDISLGIETIRAGSAINTSEKNKSVVGRTIVGGAIAGVPGAAIGAISAATAKPSIVMTKSSWEASKKLHLHFIKDNRDCRVYIQPKYSNGVRHSDALNEIERVELELRKKVPEENIYVK